MDLAIRWQRLLRALAFIGGCAFTAVALVFVFSNVTATDIHWRIPTARGFIVDWNSSGVSVWLIAAVPFLIGAIAGYAYHMPARMHHLREHMRHRDRAHELEREVKELRKSLDRILMMPEDGSLAVPAVVLPPARMVEKEAPVLAALTDGSESLNRARTVLPTSPKQAESRSKLVGGLKAELAAIKIPDTLAPALVTRPRRNGTTSPGNGRTRRARTGQSTAESAG